MEEKPYSFILERIDFRYEFLSVSSEKQVKKRVVFSATDSPLIFNLALLDVFEDGETSDISETKNKDFKTVIATVMKIIEDFLNKNQNSIVVFRGSDERRQRMYRIAISREIEQISQKFYIFGVIGEELEHYSHDKNYEYYAIKLK